MQPDKNLFKAIFYAYLFAALQASSHQINAKAYDELGQKAFYPEVQNQQWYDLQYLNQVIKQHGYGNDELNRMHFLGSFSSYQANDELTQYLHYVSNITTAVNVIYTYEELLKDFDMDEKMKNYNSQSRYYCKYKKNACGFVQLMFGETKEISSDWEEQTIEMLYNSPEVPYFLVYLSPYNQQEIVTNMAMSFYKFMVIHKTSMGLFVTTTNNRSTILNVAYLHYTGYHDMLIEIPQTKNNTLKYIWDNVHRNAKLAQLHSNFRFQYRIEIHEADVVCARMKIGRAHV